MNLSSLLSELELTEIIKKINHLHCFYKISYEIEKREDVIGFLGEYFQLNIRVDDSDINSAANNVVLFIKSLPLDNKKERLLIETWGILKKEVTLYNLLGCLQMLTKTKFVPKCYYSREDILVLEDVKISGLTHIDNVVWPFDYIRSTLKSLAALHACSIAFEIKSDTTIEAKFKDVLFEITVAEDVDYFSTGLRAIKAVALGHPMYKGNADWISKNFMRTVAPVYDMVNPSTKYKNVICHRDPWDKNIFVNVKDKQSAAILVDFQTCRYCPPAIDFLFFMYMNSRIVQREEILQECKELYYGFLSEELSEMNIHANDHISFEEFQKSCDEFKLFAILYQCVADTIINLPNNYLINLRKNNADEYFKFANVDRTEAILNFIKTSEYFKNCIYESLKELMEIILPKE